MAEEKKVIKKSDKPAEPRATTKVSDSVKKPAAKKPAQVSSAKKDDKDKVVSEVRASARYIKVGPRKVRLVIDTIRGLKADEAVDRLRFIKKSAVKPVAKLLDSAIANAQNNFEIDKKDLFVKVITATDGPTIKRFSPRAQGRSVMIRKRTSDINLILGVAAGAAKKVQKKAVTQEEVKVVSPDEIKKEKGHSHDDSDSGSTPVGKSGKGFMKGVFQRKTG